MQLAKVARFHELNALHLQAAHALYLQLDAADGTVPDLASLRALVEQVRAQPLACLRESGSFERLEIGRSEEHTSELQSLMRISYAVFCLNKTNHKAHQNTTISR